MSDIWSKLQQDHDAAEGRRIISLFDGADRMEAFTVEADRMFLDFSKTNIDREALDLLVDLAETRDVLSKRDAMFRGERINSTEDRAVLHTALRVDTSEPLTVDGEDVRVSVEMTFPVM